MRREKKFEAPSPEIEKEPKPEYYLKEWKEVMLGKILEILKDQERAMVNIAGASASGKGEACRQSKESLKKQGKRVLKLETDDFYKGISQMVMEKVIAKNPKIKSDPNEVYEMVRKIIGKKNLLINLLNGILLKLLIA